MAIMLAVGLLIPFRSIFRPEKVTSAGELIEAVDEGADFISYEIQDLTYTGYDFYQDGEVAASFYYAFTDDDSACVFFLLRSDGDINSGTARVVKGNDYSNIFLSNYAEDLGLSSEALSEISGGYIVSEYDYSWWYYVVLAALIGAAILACFVYMVVNIIIFFCPHVHTACRRLKKYGLSGRDFSDIDRELAQDCIIEAGNMFATSHYLVVFGKSTIYMVPLFNIVWAYKYLSRQLFVTRKLLSYTLVVYTSPGGRVVMRGNRKKNTDTILAFLGRDFSHITVGYTEEKHKSIKEMFEKGEL